MGLLWRWRIRREVGRNMVLQGEKIYTPYKWVCTKGKSECYRGPTLQSLFICCGGSMCERWSISTCILTHWHDNWGANQTGTGSFCWSFRFYMQVCIHLSGSQWADVNPTSLLNKLIGQTRVFAPEMYRQLNSACMMKTAAFAYLKCAHSRGLFCLN